MSNRREFIGAVAGAAGLAVLPAPAVESEVLPMVLGIKSITPNPAWANYTFSYVKPMSRAELIARIRAAIEGTEFSPPLPGALED